MRLIILAVGGYVAAYVRGHHAAAQVQRAEQVGRIAVWAVEQLSSAMGWDSSAKFARALGYAKKLATKAGLRLSDDQWQAVIEAAVRALQQAGADIPKAPAGPTAPAIRPLVTGVGATPTPRVR